MLRAFGARMGKGCRVYSTVNVWAPWNLEVGDHAIIGDRVICYSMGTISVGEWAVISQGAHLCTGTHDYDSPNFRLVVRQISIGRQAWVAADAFVGPGVTVGVGAVLGARAVAFKNLPDWTVWAGNPASCIKSRTPHPRPPSVLGLPRPEV
ncbi:MAG: LbetaH domain-containing protein [Fimbriimonadaceae bacterium]